MISPVNFNDRILVTGKTQSGKTTFVRYLFDQMHGCRRVAIDPKGRLRFPVAPTRRPRDIDPKAELVHYIPSALTRAEYNELYERVFALGGPMVVWLDEAMGPTTQNWWPEKMAIIVQQGAELQIGHWACSQRPVAIAPVLRTEAEHYFMFVPRPHYLNVDALALEVGTASSELNPLFDQLQAQEGEHSFLWYCKETHELVPCSPIPA
jgi:hypothetical protein